MEITLNSPGALASIEEISRKMEGQMLVGAGTVLDSETARAALLAGARFIISPTLNKKTIRMTKRYGAVSIPGAYTATEILKAYEYGGDIIKVFPASGVGPSYFRDVAGPLPRRIGHMPDTQDSLTDGELQSEIELVGDLVVAATSSEGPMPQEEIDRLLGVKADLDAGSAGVIHPGQEIDPGQERASEAD